MMGCKVAILGGSLRLTLANPARDVKPVSARAKASNRRLRVYRWWVAARGRIGAKVSPCYTARFPMTAKSKQDKKTKRKTTGLHIVAHAALPTRYGRFTIYGFRGRGPQEEAVALVRGNLKGKTAPLVCALPRFPT